MMDSDFVFGRSQHVCLEGDATLEQGAQDIKLWQNIGGRLAVGQQVYIENDGRTFWRWMRVVEVLGSPAAGLKHLVLADLVPPWFGKAEEHPVTAAADWKIRYSGPHLKWCVIAPNGSVKHSFINTEDEARNRARQEQGNPRPR
jgi:hypothetical protein